MLLGFFFYYRKLFRVGEPRPSQSPSVTAIALSVTCGDSSPRGRAKRESQGHLASPFGRGGRAKRGRRGYLASPFGRGGRAKRGRRGYLASPFGRGGRAKRGRRGHLASPLWERWPSEARTERARTARAFRKHNAFLYAFLF